MHHLLFPFFTKNMLESHVVCVCLSYEFNFKEFLKDFLSCFILLW